MKQQLYFMAAVDVKSCLIGKDPDSRKHWGQEEKGATEDEMVGWHHRLNGHGFEQTTGHREGQENLVCSIPRDHSQTWLSDWTIVKEVLKKMNAKAIYALVNFSKIWNLNNNYSIPLSFRNTSVFFNQVKLYLSEYLRVETYVLHCCCLVTKSCLTLCHPMDCVAHQSPHVPSQARILEWVAISSSRGSS